MSRGRGPVGPGAAAFALVGAEGREPARRLSVGAARPGPAGSCAPDVVPDVVPIAADTPEPPPIGAAANVALLVEHSAGQRPIPRSGWSSPPVRLVEPLVEPLVAPPPWALGSTSRAPGRVGRGRLRGTVIMRAESRERESVRSWRLAGTSSLANQGWRRGRQRGTGPGVTRGRPRGRGQPCPDAAGLNALTAPGWISKLRRLLGNLRDLRKR